MDKVEHGLKLKAAMAAAGASREKVADAVGHGVKTITNWRSGATMPDEHDRMILQGMFPGYDDEGDQVEASIRRSPLLAWRQDSVLSFYRRNLHEQQAEEVGDA